MHSPDTPQRGVLTPAITLAALGVVYGDIGTSPLYAMNEAVKASGGGGNPATVLGIVSLIFWALILIISLKYAVLIMRADNRGEGGIVALLAILAGTMKGGQQRLLLIVGLIGAALLYGDGVITPAISVLSAIEGLKIAAPALTPMVVPITLVVLVALFGVQHYGTARIGTFFGPIVLLWFTIIAMLGIAGIVRAPEVLVALNPWHAVSFLVTGPAGVSFAVIGAAFLAVTGGEAMYADMGHFGKDAIRLAWFAIVLPALILNYFGQGALILADPSAAGSSFYLLAPSWLLFPLILLAAAATVIASQAIISGAYSLTRQSIQLGLLPRMTIRQTGQDEIGQIYIPLVNWLMAIFTILAVVLFRSSDALAGAYGIAVSLLMAITTLLAALVARKWGFPLLLILAVNGSFLVIDLVFVAANMGKLEEGGWYPLMITAGVVLIMLTWRRGTMLLEEARRHLRPAEADFLETAEVQQAIRLPGPAAYLSAASRGIPTPLTSFVRHNHAMQDRILLVTVVSDEVPRTPPEYSIEVTSVHPGIERVVLRFGFMEKPDVPHGLRSAVQRGLLRDLDVGDISYYIGRETVIASRAVVGMAVWREVMFGLLQRSAERSAAWFGIPASQVVEIGVEIEI